MNYGSHAECCTELDKELKVARTLIARLLQVPIAPVTHEQVRSVGALYTEADVFLKRIDP